MLNGSIIVDGIAFIISALVYPLSVVCEYFFGSGLRNKIIALVFFSFFMGYYSSSVVLETNTGISIFQHLKFDPAFLILVILLFFMRQIEGAMTKAHRI